MSKKPARSSLGFDPTIENPKSKIQNRDGWSRREFLTTAALAGTGALLGLRSKTLAGEARPETTRLRLVHGPSMCQAPQYLAEELLRAEGFVDVQYAKKEKAQGIEQALASYKRLLEVEPANAKARAAVERLSSKLEQPPNVAS